MLASVLGWLNRVGPSVSVGGESLLGRNEFQIALRRERLRSDRSAQRFALLTLESETRLEDTAEAGPLSAVVLNRIRETDAAGWMNDRKVGVVLPYTPAAGAWKVAHDLGTLLREQGLSLRFEVYIYPSNDTSDGQPPEEVSDSGVVVDDSRSPVQPMEALFVQASTPLKRVIDIVCASAAIVLALPVMIIAAIAIKMTSKGPIFYAQMRDGHGGHRFWIYKFRTMVVDAEEMKAKLRAMSEQDGPAFKLKNDPRVTPIGRWLRRTCVDELPQLFNVIRGDMSIVGPRPMCSKEASNCNQWERRRLDVIPGLTCIWQVHGGTKVSFSEWMRMDLRYIGSCSLWNDLGLMVMTVPSVIRRDGVY